MKTAKLQNLRRERRRLRNRAKIFGTPERPRLSVFRSNKYTSVQLVDDESGKTLLAASTRELKETKKSKRVEQARLLGELVAAKAQKLGIRQAVFNKGRYLYHGRVKAVAEGARSKGLKL